MNVRYTLFNSLWHFVRNSIVPLPTDNGNLKREGTKLKSHFDTSTTADFFCFGWVFLFPFALTHGIYVEGMLHRSQSLDRSIHSQLQCSRDIIRKKEWGWKWNWTRLRMKMGFWCFDFFQLARNPSAISIRHGGQNSYYHYKNYIHKCYHFRNLTL